MDIGVIEKKSYQGVEVMVYKKSTPCQRAQFAMELISRGMTVGIDDGEDSAGRAKGKENPPKELVERACQIADTAFNEFEVRGWILELPAPQVVPIKNPCETLE